MTTRDGDMLTLLGALDASGRLNQRERQPFLLKAIWDSEIWMGELIFSQDGILIEWGGASVPSSLTDFGGAPVHIGAVFRVHDGDDERSAPREFSVRAVDRLN